MRRTDINPMPPFFDRYINLVDDIDLLEAFEVYTPQKIYSEQRQLELLGNKVYEPGKWTIKDILQHVIDNERIMSYRALRFSRNDKTPLPGYDEAILGANTMASSRSIADLMAEFEQVRAATILLFKNMDETMLLNAGIANSTSISPLALGYVILGHPVSPYEYYQRKILPADLNWNQLV